MEKYSLEEILKHKSRIKQLVKEYPINYEDISDSLNSIGIVCTNQARYAEALHCFRQTLEIKRQTLPDNHINIAELLYNVGLAYDNLEKYDEAFECYKQSFDVSRERIPPKHP